MDRPRRLLALLSGLVLLVACGTPRDGVRIEPVGRGASTPAAVGSELSSPSRVRPLEGAVPPAALSSTESTARTDETLLAAILDALGADAEHYSVVVRRLRDGRGAALNAEREFYAASLFKLAVLYEAERQRSAGLLDFDEAVAVTDADVAEDLGTFGFLEVDDGGMIPVRAAVSAMVTRSDNTSAVLLLRLLGPGVVDRTLERLGLEHTSVNTRDLPTTAADMATLMEAIVRGEGVERAWREDMVRLLLLQETRSGIPSRLPAGVRVGNKTGTWEGATHDVAFVDAPGGLYVIAVLSDRGWDWEPIARVSRAVYDALAR